MFFGRLPKWLHAHGLLPPPVRWVLCCAGLLPVALSVAGEVPNVGIIYIPHYPGGHQLLFAPCQGISVPAAVLGISLGFREEGDGDYEPNYTHVLYI